MLLSVYITCVCICEEPVCVKVAPLDIRSQSVYLTKTISPLTSRNGVCQVKITCFPLKIVKNSSLFNAKVALGKSKTHKILA